MIQHEPKQPPGFKWYARWAKTTGDVDAHKKLWKKFKVFCKANDLDTELAWTMLTNGIILFPTDRDAVKPRTLSMIHGMGIIYCSPIPEEEFNQKYTQIFGGDFMVKIIREEDVAELTAENELNAELHGERHDVNPVVPGAYMEFRPLPMGTGVRDMITEQSQDMLTISRAELAEAEEAGDEHRAEMARNIIRIMENMMTTMMAWGAGYIPPSAVRFSPSELWHAVRHDDDGNATNMTYCGHTGAAALIDQGDKEYASVWGYEQTPGQSHDTVEQCQICQRIMDAEFLEEGDDE